MCTEECPLSHPYYATVRRKVTTNYSYRTTFVLVTYCLDTCNDNKSPGKYVFNNTCVNRCPNTTVLYESKCVVECPSDKPQTYTKEDEGKYLIVCVEDCPGPTFTKGRYCYDQCPEPLASYSPNRTCLEQCPTHRKFRYRFRTNGNNFAFKCKTTCGNKFINSNTCVDTCPSDEPLLLGQTCVSECPASHMLVSYQMHQCLETCKPPLVELNHTCYRHCPVSSPFVLDNKCVKECPTTFNLTAPSPQGTVCARECKSPLIRENNKCIRTCPDKKFIINNVCEYVLGCPKPYSYIEHSSQGTTCRKNCENNEFFLEDFQCTKKCPKFAVGRKCVDKCPKTHPYTFKKYSGEDITLCRSVCPNWIFKKNCVSYCPTGYVKLNSNKTCVKDCPPSAPIYNSRCVRPCPHGTYPNNDNNCVPKTLGYQITIIALAVSGICFFTAAYLMFRRTTCLPCAASENKVSI
ncbi:proprotein convertase subtilisin/kexin type 5-like [Pecten maximus]|uniref:proprotein convertase subtilisin/kexin type 5-like n=1 Tax=Pecten maximus TaxID=6579 RepID=UPI001458B575|nr:proprotein convertase subtilisin/kexin type 5-like [Pecten maximus]